MTFLGSCENQPFYSQTGVATFWVTFGKTWATFYFNIWSHGECPELVQMQMRPMRVLNVFWSWVLILTFEPFDQYSSIQILSIRPKVLAPFFHFFIGFHKDWKGDQNQNSSRLIFWKNFWKGQKLLNRKGGNFFILLNWKSTSLTHPLFDVTLRRPKYGGGQTLKKKKWKSKNQVSGVGALV